ncbi:MAG: TonB-dependent receptor [Verrucomicrobia bacterium]|nr:TonB-dependent receptor [Verrucomicrobiota bacterium]
MRFFKNSTRKRSFFRSKPVIYIACLIAGCFPGYAQEDVTGTVQGSITDSWEGIPLPGVNVTVRGTTLGASTDISGQYHLKGVPQGNHILIFNKSGYTRATVADVRVIAAQLSTVNLEMKPEFYELEPFDVITDPQLDQSVALLSERQDSAALTDAIGSDFFSRAGAGNAADIMTKVTGASVVGGKYVFIRGLGERYSNTTLNGAEVPSADPDKRAVQMDIFPANAIQSVVTSKTFTPDRPGGFSGGSVDIITKSFPEKFNAQVGFSTTYNTQSSMKDDFLTYPGGNLDWLGMQDGTRELPAEWEAGGINSQDLINDTRSGGGRTDASRTAAAEKLIALTSLFEPVMRPTRGTSGLDHGFNASVGDTKKVADRDLGFLFGLNYDRDYSFYKDGTTGRHKLSGDSVETDLLLNDTRGIEEVSWGGLATLAYKLSENHEIGFNFLFNHSSEDEARLQSGFLQGFEDSTFETSTLHYIVRELRSFQLKGTHEFPELLDLKTDWIAALSSTTQDEPDLRFFSYDRADTGRVNIALSGYDAPTRYFRELLENNQNLKLDNAIPFSVWSGLESQLKFGAYYSATQRTYEERRFAYNTSSNPRWNDLVQTGDPDSFLDPSNVTYEATGRGTYRFNKYIQELPFNNYTGDQNIHALYSMIDIPVVERFKITTGARYETTDLSVVNSGERTGNSSVNESAILPAASSVYELKENMNLRLAYGKTLARPTFREIALVPVFDFMGGDILIGNPDLDITSINNYDFRWEWFPQPNEVLAASLFYKTLTSPIEKQFVTANRQVQYQNRDQATVYGLELEARKSLERLSENLRDFTVGGNFTYVVSEVNVTPFEYEFGRNETRQLAGQSPYIFNFDVTYNNDRSGTIVSLFYNVFGPRLAVVGSSSPARPNAFERPVGTLDMTVSQQLTDHWKLKLSAKNLLDPTVDITQEYNAQEYIYSSYKRGRSFGMSLSYDF